MPPKQKTPAPIDRPLSKAYLREFSGWSTAYPPGLSDPSSLRTMENVQINRDGSARVRPGLRYMSFMADGLGVDKNCVGSHEPFFLNDGTKAYLFAVREADGTVGFRVLVGSVVKTLTASGVDFSVPQGVGVLAFSSATTYVKYLQIDNKIFALSNAGETMRLFTVGATKTAKKLSSIVRPDYVLADKLTVVHPDAGWVNNSTPSAVRTNLIPTPNFESSIGGWATDGITALLARSTAQSSTGAASGRLESLPERSNYSDNPSFQNDIDGITVDTYNGASLAHNAGMGRTENGFARLTTVNLGGATDETVYVKNRGGLKIPVVAGRSYAASIYTNIRSSVAIYPNAGTPNRPVYVRIRVEWYNASGGGISSITSQSWLEGMNDWGFRPWVAGVAPAGAAYAQVAVVFDVQTYYGDPAGDHNTGDWYLPKLSVDIDDFLFEGSSGLNTYMDGDTGGGAVWLGTPNQSASVIHPAKDIQANTPMMSVTAALNYVGSLYARADSTARNMLVSIYWYNASSTFLSQTNGGEVANSAAAWNRYTASAAAPAGATQARVVVTVRAVPRGEYHYIDAAMFEQAAAVGSFFDGDNVDTATVKYDWTGAQYNSTSTESTYAAGSTVPPAETPTANTLLSSTAASNIYNFAYFYTISNEVGESAASMVTVIRVQRRWTGWKWEAANAAGEPNGTIVNDPNLAADQLVAYMPQAVYDAAKAQGATAWNLYMLTWSDQDSVPVEGILLGTKAITAGGSYGAEGWQRNTPALANTGYAAQLPTATNRYNFSAPSSAAQGLVASDRMILVDDPAAPAVIKWSSNQQGEYTNFTAAKGGGYKTLTSGNLFVPSAVKLWQNPQSVDTLTILCAGVDGQNVGYYMAPASISQQSETVTVMGFEETTATPGTVSPYGCEVLNNALYHPLDTELMKSTASNYNINHKPMTEQIVDSWSRLQNKQRIVSSQLDGRLYFIVHNPYGENLLTGCMGNEIWVFDAMSKSGTWSRWLIQASSLRKIESGGKVFMSVVRPDGIFYLDPFYDRDDVVDPVDRSVDTEWISWKLETNTQGANRAHDAWCHLQQVQMSLGNFKGTVKWGIIARDVHGKDVSRSIVTKDPREAPTDLLPYDITATLAVRRDIMEWRLFAQSVEGEQSYGQIDFVQYRYTPVSVNVGYEYGEVETFEYGRSQVQLTDKTTDNGVPQPFADMVRP